MKVQFADNDLSHCAASEAAATRKWGPVVARKYIQRIRQFYAARDIATLMELRSLRLHRLHGQRDGLWAMTLHDRWRIVFSLAHDETVTIEEVSNHYDD